MSSSHDKVSAFDRHLPVFPILLSASEFGVLVSFNCQINTAHSLPRKESQLRDFPDQIDLWVICTEKSSPLWVASIPGQMVMGCIRKLDNMILQKI